MKEFLQSIDWAALAVQKQALLDDLTNGDLSCEGYKPAFEGLVSLIDVMQDKGEDLGLPVVLLIGQRWDWGKEEFVPNVTEELYAIKRDSNDEVVAFVTDADQASLLCVSLIFSDGAPCHWDEHDENDPRAQSGSDTEWPFVYTQYGWVWYRPNCEKYFQPLVQTAPHPNY